MVISQKLGRIQSQNSNFLKVHSIHCRQLPTSLPEARKAQTVKDGLNFIDQIFKNSMGRCSSSLHGVIFTDLFVSTVPYNSGRIRFHEFKSKYSFFNKFVFFS